MDPQLRIVKGIQVSRGLVLVAEEDLYAQFQPFGFTPKTFRSTLKALGLKCIEMPNGTRLYDRDMFILMWKFAASPRRRGGSFHCHGEAKLTKGALAKDAVSRLPAPTDAELTGLASDLLASAYLGTELPRELPAFKAAVTSVVNRLRASLAQVATDAQTALDHNRALVAKLAKHRNFVEHPSPTPPSPPDPLPSAPSEPSVMGAPTC